MEKTFCHLPIDCLTPGRFQPRHYFNQETLIELAKSIQSQGLIEPLIVRMINENSYEIVAGERRWRAAQIAKLPLIPCIVGTYNDKQACAISVVENIQRENLNAIEEANAFQRMIYEFKFQQDEIAILVSKSRSYVANSLRLLTLVESVRILVAEQKLSVGHARVLVGLESSVQISYAHQVISEQWSVRELEQQIKKIKNNCLTKSKSKDKDIERLQNILSEQVGAPVKFDDEGTGGWLKLKYFNNDTLAGLLDKLGLRYD